MYGLKHPCTTMCQVFYFSWFLFFFFFPLSFSSFLFCHFLLRVNYILLFIYFKFPSLVLFFFLVLFYTFQSVGFFFFWFIFSPLICYFFIYQDMKVNLYKLHFLSPNFNLLYLSNIRMYYFTYNKHNHNKCLLITIRVNYVFAPYTLYYISI